ncbi:hypothetical protein QBC45DRAFT_459265 [Copromyces sp. CBS 386.78]|nr:hypothetical protein QBC45DRAFT_459265 [Copromyces sp. CBS 386.78]
MESKDSNPRQGSDPYEYIISWAKQINKEDSGEPPRLGGEDDDDGRNLSAGDDSQVDMISDSSDSVEAVLDIYLDIQKEGEQGNASNPYDQLQEWAKRFEDDKFNVNEDTKMDGENVNDEDKDKQTKWAEHRPGQERRQRELHSPPPPNIDDDYFHVVRHPGHVCAAVAAQLESQAITAAVGDPTPVGAAPGTAVQPIRDFDALSFSSLAHVRRAQAGPAGLPTRSPGHGANPASGIRKTLA